MAIFEDEVRSATVRAVGDTRVLEVDKKTVEKRLQDDPRLAVNMLKTMSSRVREGHTRLEEASVPDASEPSGVASPSSRCSQPVPRLPAPAGSREAWLPVARAL